MASKDEILAEFDKFSNELIKQLPEWILRTALTLFNEIVFEIKKNGVKGSSYKRYVFYAPTNNPNAVRKVKASKKKGIVSSKTGKSLRFEDGFKGYKIASGFSALPANNQVTLEFTGEMFDGMTINRTGDSFDIEFTNSNSAFKYTYNVKRYGDFINITLNDKESEYENFLALEFEDFTKEVIINLNNNLIKQ